MTMKAENTLNRVRTTGASLFRPIRLTAGTNFAGRWRRAPRYGRARWIIVNRGQKT